MTAQNLIKSARVDIRMTSGSGMKLEAGFNSTSSVPAASGDKVLRDALAEITRLLCIAGHEAETRIVFDDAARRVREWRREREGKKL